MTEITGENRLPRLTDHDPPQDENEAIWLSSQAVFQHHQIRRDPHLLAELLQQARAEGEATGYANGAQEATIQMLELQHVLAHPEIPAPLIAALQRGPNLADPLGGTSFSYAGVVFTVTVTRTGTHTPIPDSARVWIQLKEIITDVTARPYCERTIAPLPQEIAAIVWTDAHGRTIRVEAPRPR